MFGVINVIYYLNNTNIIPVKPSKESGKIKILKTDNILVNKKQFMNIIGNTAGCDIEIDAILKESDVSR